MSVWQLKTGRQFIADLSPEIKHDVFSLLLGERISYGSARHVYAHADKRYVVKIEEDEQSFQNILEWKLWSDVKDTTMRRWFAPCFEISKYGSALVQAKTTPVKKLPKKLPAFFADIKVENFGFYQGRVVCHDYALNYATVEFLRRYTKLKTLPERRRVEAESEEKT